MTPPSFLTATRCAKLRELSASLAALFVVPLAFVPYFWGWLGAIILVGLSIAVGLTFAGLGRMLDGMCQEADKREAHDAEAFVYKSVTQAYDFSKTSTEWFAVTPHRLEILRKRGTSTDVVEDLRSLCSETLVVGRDFHVRVREKLGSARFHDEVKSVSEVFYAAHSIESLEDKILGNKDEPPDSPE